MALDRKGELGFIHAAAIIAHAKDAAPALFGLNGDVARACIQRVLDQLLDSSRGAFHDLTGRDTVHRFGRKQPDPAGTVGTAGGPGMRERIVGHHLKG